MGLGLIRVKKKKVSERSSLQMCMSLMCLMKALYYLTLHDTCWMSNHSVKWPPPTMPIAYTVSSNTSFAHHLTSRWSGISLATLKDRLCIISPNAYVLLR